LTSIQFQALTTSQLANLSTRQIASLEVADLLALSGTQLRSIAPAGISALTSDEIAAFTTQHMTYLSVVQIPLLSTSNLNSLTTSQLKALTSTQIASLSTKQVSALSTNALASLTSVQVQAITAVQIRALGAKVSVVGSSTPIVLDLNGDGIRTTSWSDGVKFDLLANGQAIQTAWVNPEDGLLVRDRNGDGVVNDGRELFGSASLLANGAVASDGFAALNEMDTNQDGWINQDDETFGQLRIWIDTNQNGVTDGNELKTLGDLNIQQLSVNASGTDTQDQGNLIGLTSSYQTADGLSHSMADVWFRIAGEAQAKSSFPEVTQANDSSALVDRVQSLTGAIAKFEGAENPDYVVSMTSVNSEKAFRNSSSLLPVTALVDAMYQFQARLPEPIAPAFQSSSTGESMKGVLYEASPISREFKLYVKPGGIVLFND
jgi:hypothetical protein